MRRSPLRRQSRDRVTETIPDAPRLIREQVLARALYRCEAQCCRWCWGSVSLQLHHRLRRRHEGPNTPENLVAVCPDCHAWIHGHPDQAYRLGLLVHRHDGPPSQCWTPSPPGATLSP